MAVASATVAPRASLLERPANLPRLDSLTGLRFFAAFPVVMHHFTSFAQLPLIWHWAGFGSTGVSFFFVLSGFVLTWSFVPGDTAPRFYWRRFARVWPLHLVTTLLAVPVFYMWRDVPMDWTGVILSLFLLHAWVPAVNIYFAGNPASWSLSCELFFYAIHPFLVRKTLAAGIALLAAATAIVLVALYVVADLAIDWPARIAGWLLYIAPIFRVGEFLVGMALASAIRRGVRFPIGIIPSVLLLGAWFTLYYNIAPRLDATLQIAIADLSYPAMAVLYGLLIAAAAQRDLARRPSLLRSRPMVLLGQWSYALYLIHATIIYALIELIGVRSYSVLNVGWLVAVSAVTVSAAALLYYGIEHPLEGRLRRMQQRQPLESGQSTAAAGATAAS
ncbi:MAG: acyltransferase [Anaerolineaceae bacterium]